MKKFSEFGINPSIKSLTGDKIKIGRILNKQIIVTDYKLEPSKYGTGKDPCLYLQFTLDDKKHVLFTGAAILIETIKQIPKHEFPFSTTIIKEEEWYEFS